MSGIRWIIPATVAVAIAVGAGTASANANTVDANCAGMTFNMARGETGTVVTTRLNGRPVRTDTVATFGAPVVFSIPSPDQGAVQVWAVTVDSVFNADQSWTETVPVCIEATTTTVVPTTTTAPTTTVTVAVTDPPAPTTTVVTPPRVTTVTTVPTVATVPTTLPETGAASNVLGFTAAFFVALGSMLVWINRRPS